MKTMLERMAIDAQRESQLVYRYARVYASPRESKGIAVALQRDAAYAALEARIYIGAVERVSPRVK